MVTVGDILEDKYGCEKDVDFSEIHLFIYDDEYTSDSYPNIVEPKTLLVNPSQSQNFNDVFLSQFTPKKLDGYIDENTIVCKGTGKNGYITSKNLFKWFHENKIHRYDRLYAIYAAVEGRFYNGNKYDINIKYMSNEIEDMDLDISRCGNYFSLTCR